MELNNYQGKLQNPIGSGFNASSTASEVIKGIDLNGKTAIVTGGHTGIGLETTKTLSAAGATVLVLARDIEKAEKNLTGLPNVELHAVDLMNPESINTFAEQFLLTGRPLHMLINNAGIMYVPLRRDSRGIESQLSTNHLGHFHLTAKLWPALKQANGARIINVSSAGHQFGGFHFEDPNFEHREYESLQGYGQSKTANNLFAVELDNRGKEFHIRAFSLHPGNVLGTDLLREPLAMEYLKQMGLVDENGNIYSEVLKSLKTIPQGAATTVWCATSSLLDNIGGVYCEDADIAVLNSGNSSGAEAMNGVLLSSLDETDAKQLWNLSEEMTGVIFQVG